MVDTAPLRGSLREQQRAYTRGRLLQGAQEVFAEKGYIATTVDDIVAAAGASRATFYLYFKTKREVVTEMGLERIPELKAMYVQLDEVLSVGTRESMREWVAGAIEWMDEHRVTLAAADAASIVDGPGADVGPSSYVMQLVDEMPVLLSRWPADQRHRARIRVGLLATQFQATYFYLLHVAGVREALSQSDLVDALTDIWFAGLLPPVAEDTEPDEQA